MKTKNNIIAALVMNSAIALAFSAGLNAATKTVTVGNSMFGATATGTIDYVTPSQGNTCTFTGTGRVDGKVLYKSLNFLSSHATLRVDHGSNRTSTSGYIKAGNKTLAAWIKSSAGSSTFTTAPLTQLQKGGSFDFLRFVTVSTDASCKLQMIGNLNAVILPGAKTRISASFGPSVDVGVTGKGGVDVWLASAGVTGSLKLCKMSAIASVTMEPSALIPNSSLISYKADFNMTSPHGKLSVYFDALGFDPVYGTICSWTGKTSSYPITSGSFTLRPTPIVQYK